MGNFTINTYDGVVVVSGEVRVQYVLDMAEIPTFQARGEVAAAGVSYASSQCRRLAGGLHLAVDGKARPLGLDSAGGRIVAAAAVGAGSIAICHLNDPLFWIAAHMGGLSPTKALRIISLGSAIMALLVLLLLFGLSRVL